METLGISRRQAQHWAATGVAGPSVKTKGGHFRYSCEDLAAMKTVKRLIDAGVSVQRIRTSIKALRKIFPSVERPLSELVFVVRAGDLVLVFAERADIESVKKYVGVAAP